MRGGGVGSRKVATTVYLTTVQDGALKDLALRTGLPVAEWVRRGVDRILTEHAAELEDPPPPDTAARKGLAARRRQGVA